MRRLSRIKYAMNM